MDRHESQVPTNSTHANGEVSAARLILDDSGDRLKSKNKTLSKIAAMSAVTLALVGCGPNTNAEGPQETVAPTGTSISETPAPVETSDATETPSPAETETPVETDELDPGVEGNDPAITPENQAQRLAELQFSPEMTPEELGEQYIEIGNGWVMAGAVPELYQEWYDAGVPNLENFALEIAQRNTATYATAFFGENYETIDNERIQNFIRNCTIANQKNIIWYVMSLPSPQTDTRNIVTWNSHSEIEEDGITTEEQTDTESTIVIRAENVNNGAGTMFGEIDWVQDENGSVTDSTITFDTSGSVPTVTDISVDPVS